MKQYALLLLVASASGACVDDASFVSETSLSCADYAFPCREGAVSFFLINT